MANGSLNLGFSGGSLSLGGGIKIGSLVAEVIADTTKWAKGLSKATSMMSGFLKKTDMFMKRNAQTMRTMGVRVALIGAAITASLGKAVKEYGDFDRAMRQAAAVSNATEGQFIKMSDMAEKASIKFNISAVSSARAFYYLGSAGLSVSEQMEAFNDVVAFAKAGVMDVAFAAETLVDVMKGTHTSFKDTVIVTDILTKAFISSNMNLSQLGESMSLVASIAEEANTPLNEVAAAFGFMANAGIKGSRAGTALRRAFVNLMDPSSEVRKELRRWNIEVFDANDNMRVFTDIMIDLVSALETASGKERKHAIATIFGVRAITGMLNIINQGPEAIRNFAKEMDDSAGTTTDVVGKQMKAFAEETGQAIQEVKALGREIGRLLAPAVLSLARGLGQVTKSMREWSKEHKMLSTTLVSTIAAIGATLSIVGSLAAMLGSLALIAGAVGVSFGALLLVVGAVIVGIAALVAAVTAVVMNYSKWKKKNEEIDNQIKSNTKSIKESTEAWAEYNKELVKTKKGQEISDVAKRNLELQKKALEVLKLVRREREPAGFIGYADRPGTLFTSIGLAAWFKTSDAIKKKMKEVGLNVTEWRDENLASLETWANTVIRMQGKVGNMIEESAKKEINAIQETSKVLKKSTKDHLDWFKMIKEARDEYVEDLKEQYPTIQIYIKEGMKTVFDDVHDGLKTSLADLAEGTKSFEEVFINMIQRIHRSLLDFFADIAARNIMMSLMGNNPYAGNGARGQGLNILGSIVGSAAMSGGGGLPVDSRGFMISGGRTVLGAPVHSTATSAPSWLMGAATGGIFKGGFRALKHGGIVTEPTMGLVGEGDFDEAVVPLPDGRSIPVQMQGTGKPVVISINVNAINSRDTYRFLASNKRAIASLVEDALRDNHPSRRR